MDIKVLLQALNHVWLIEPNAADNYALILHKLFTGESASFSISEQDEKPRDFAWIVNASGQRIGTIADAVDNGVAVINLKGAVMKYDYCGAAGTQSMMKALQQANDNPSVSAILLQIDSPGGSVDGTQQFATAIKNSAKPVVAYVNGMMASAAMWIGSAAQQRMASSNTDTIGSIGTMAAWNDWKGYYERVGVKPHQVYATASTHKNLPFREANGLNADGKTNYEPMIKTWLDPTNEEFMNAIQQNLPKADNTVLNGAAYIATEAKKKGLIDKIGTFEEAVKTAMKLGKQQQQIQNNNSMKWSKILAVLSLGLISSAADVKLEDKDLDTLEAVVNERDQLKTENATLKTDVATAKAAEKKATDELATANASITAKDAEIKKLTDEVAALNKKDATVITTVTTEKDKAAVAAVNEFETSYDREMAKLNEAYKG